MDVVSSLVRNTTGKEIQTIKQGNTSGSSLYLKFWGCGREKCYWIYEDGSFSWKGVALTFHYCCQTNNHANKHPPGCYNTPQVKPTRCLPAALPWNICTREGGGWTHAVKGLIMVWHQCHPLGKCTLSIQHLEETSVLMEVAGGYCKCCPAHVLIHHHM